MTLEMILSNWGDQETSYPNLENGVVWDDDQRDLLHFDLDLALE